MSTKSKEIPSIQYSANGKIITFARPLVMAIVNLTPDSFYDGGKYGGTGDILHDVEDKVRQGADIIDLGAASSRPNAPETDARTEWERLGPALAAIRKTFPEILLSVDTYRSAIARQSAREGADMINDISGGDLDEEMFETVAALNLPYILMHMEGDPRSMTRNPPYSDVLKTVTDALGAKINKLQQLNFHKVITDPGFGFGKSLENNFELLKGLPAIAALGPPVLAGISRKSMINKVLGSNPVTSLNGTTVLNTIALLNGAGILRVHDVTEAMQAIRLVEFYRNV